MTTAYCGDIGDGTLGLSTLTYLPFQTRLKNGRNVQVAAFEREDWNQGIDLMNLIIREGRTWPFRDEFATLEDYRRYFLSHTALVVRAAEAGVDNQGNHSPTNDFMGCFYVKPNFPGRCSHVCNGGFITAPRFRGQGVGRLMGHVFLQIARDLDYKSAYFNLVFKSNPVSIALWESLGFQRVAVLEKAAALEGVDGLDTAFGYRFDLETLQHDYLHQHIQRQLT
ncbi:hypothetical protein MPSEU_000040600 [Mayamaea pseudoterrestris]|nr:hypothetical protein MPSEU_000040600 [Mayamaea pseudoterrestris]